MKDENKAYFEDMACVTPALPASLFSSASRDKWARPPETITLLDAFFFEESGRQASGQYVFPGNIQEVTLLGHGKRSFLYLLSEVKKWFWSWLLLTDEPST